VETIHGFALKAKPYVVVAPENPHRFKKCQTEKQVEQMSTTHSKEITLHTLEQVFEFQCMPSQS